MRLTSLALAASLLLAAPAAQAQTTYTTSSAFLAAVPVTTLYGFEGLAAPGGIIQSPNLSPLTVTVSGGADLRVFVYGGSFNGGTFSLNGSANLLAGLNNGGGNPVIPTTTIQLGGSFTAVGTEIGFRNGNVGPVTSAFTATLFNGVTQVGNAYTSPSLETGYIGFTSALPFDRVLFSNNVSSGSFTVFDNLRTGSALSVGTPEPGSLALLLGLGAAGAGLLRRRRRMQPQ